MDWKLLQIILVSLHWHLSKGNELSGKFLRVSKDFDMKQGRRGRRYVHSPPREAAKDIYVPSKRPFGI